MAQAYRQVSSCSPSQTSDAYIYAIIPTSDSGIAAITSADELLVVNGENLLAAQTLRFQSVPKGLTSLISVDEGKTVICAGNDGSVSTFDIRTQNRAAHFKIDRGVTALASDGNDVAIGTELSHQQAVVSVWDRRQSQQRWQNTENNDDITALHYHPIKHKLLLSGGDDGLVSIFDTEVPEEDDSLIQAFNHGPIHKAGFLGHQNIYALSSDHNLALHPVFEEDQVEDPAPVLLGDLRPIIPCEYVIDVFRSSKDYVVAAGSHSKSRVDLITIQDAQGVDLERRIVLEGAHGEEIVRSIFADETNGIIFTAGEDGQVKAFKPAETKFPEIASPKSSKVRKVSEARYKPY